MANVISSFPSINPLAVMLLFILIPPIIILVVIWMIWKNYHWRGTFLNKFVSNLGVVLNHHAPLVTCVNLSLGILLFLNQGAYVLNNYDTTSDIKYYLRVDRPEFVNYNVIFNAQALNSITAIRLQANIGFGRRLAADDDGSSNPTNLLNFIYHLSDWTDITGEQQLINICKTEQNIFKNLPCLENQYDYTFKSFISDYMNTTTCQFLDSYDQTRGQIGYFANSQYFSDRTMYSSINSPILISYFRMGSCGDVYNSNEFIQSINAQAVGDTMVVPASSAYLAEDLTSATDDLQQVMFYSGLAAFIFLVFSVRGVIVAIATLFCVALSLLNGAALLDQFGYTSISVFDTTSLLVVLSIGAGFVHLYGAAWRHTVKRGKNASPQCLMRIFGTVGKGNLLTFLACCLAFFALGNAPVIFMSQMGYFIGISMLVFFVSFHYIIVPMWVWTSWYVIPAKYHNNWRIFRQKYFRCLMSRHEDVHVHHHHHRGEGERGLVLARHGHSGDDGDDAMYNSDEGSDQESSVSSASVVAAVVAADQVRFASDTEGAQAVQATPAGGHYDEMGNFIADDYADDYEISHNDDDAVVPAATSTVEDGATTAAAAVVNDDDTEEDDDEWSCTWAGICRGKRPVKMLGFFMLLATVFLILLSAVQSQQIMKTNFAYARLIDSDTNLATVLQVFQYYRGDVFYAVDDDNSATITVPFAGSPAPSYSPTFNPTVAGNPTASPTLRPTVSSRPTVAPSHRPTLSPTIAPTTDSGDPAAVYTDYHVTGCWGLGASKAAYDAGADPEFSYDSFRDYMSKNNNGLLGDMASVCEYVDANRDSLDVHPDWNRTRDCIYNQVFQIYNSNNTFISYSLEKSVANAVFLWGTTVDTSPSMVGLYSNETNQATLPVWVCANFSGRSYVDTFNNHKSYGLKLRGKWEDVFYKHGSANAKASGISVVVSSTEFTYPLLGTYITTQVEYQAFVFIIGFPILLLLFTAFDYGLTVFGVMGFFTIYLLTIFIGLSLISTTLNLGDVVALVILIPYMVCFNIHLITCYMSNRTLEFRKTGRVEPDIQFLSPTLLKTQRYMFKALIGPLLLGVLAAIAFTESSFPILRRFGRYYIICAIVAYLFSVTIQPFLLAFTCKCSVCTFDYIEDEEELPPSSPPPPPPPPPLVDRPPRTLTRRTTQDPGLARPGSQFAMNSVYNNSSQFAMNNDIRGVELSDMPTAGRAGGTRSVASRTGSVVSVTDPQYGEYGVPMPAPVYEGYDNQIPANAVHLGTTSEYMMVPPQQQPQPLGISYVSQSSPQQHPQQGYDYAYGGGNYQQVQQVDEYGRPIQMMPVQQIRSPPGPGVGMGGRGIRHIPSRMQPPPAASQSQYFYSSPSAAAALQEESVDGDSYAYSAPQGGGSQYQSSAHRQMFLPPSNRMPQQQQPPPPTSSPSFYSNRRAATSMYMPNELQQQQQPYPQNVGGRPPLQYAPAPNPNMSQYMMQQPPAAAGYAQQQQLQQQRRYGSQYQMGSEYPDNGY